MFRKEAGGVGGRYTLPLMNGLQLERSTYQNRLVTRAWLAGLFFSLAAAADFTVNYGVGRRMSCNHRSSIDCFLRARSDWGIRMGWASNYHQMLDSV